MGLVIAGCLVMTYVSLNYEALDWQPVVWLFVQSLVPLHCLSDFPDDFLRSLHRLFPYRGKCRFLHRHYLDFYRLHGYGDFCFPPRSFWNFDMEWFALLQPHGMRGRRGLCGIVHSGCRIDL